MPDFPAPAEIKAAACRAIEADINQYAVTWGAAGLRQAVAEHAAWHLGLEVDPETEITVTCGSTEAMLVALLALINPGDEVILTQPFYENYWPDCVLAGATPRFVALRPPGWHLDLDELAAAFNDRTKAIILCNPNNPTGTVFGRAELEQVAALCRRWDAIAITDEIYEHIVYDGRAHIALAPWRGCARSVTIGGMSKTYAVTGWRIGTMIAPPHLTAAFRQIHDFVSIGAAAPLQEAGATAYRLPRDYYRPAGRRLPETPRPPLPRPAGGRLRPGVAAGGLLRDGRHRRLRRHRRRGVRPVSRPRDWRGDGPRLQLLPGSGPGPAVRPVLLLQARRDPRRGHRAAAGHRLTNEEWTACPVHFPAWIPTWNTQPSGRDGIRDS
jgi:histidinol-phosphate/aromatic aminotransferase/cobyric acid decarboxylase-like protein